MAFDAIVRASFETNPTANQAVNRALVGHAQNRTGDGPFVRVGTHAFACSQADDQLVAEAIEQLGEAVEEYGAFLDFLSISIVRNEQD